MSNFIYKKSYLLEGFFKILFEKKVEFPSEISCIAVKVLFSPLYFSLFVSLKYSKLLKNEFIKFNKHLIFQLIKIF